MITKEDLVMKRCEYCLFEHILPEEYRKKENLDKPLPEGHPRRVIIEELCHGDGSSCPMKEVAMRAKCGDREAYQWEVVEIFKLDLSKSERKELSFEETFLHYIKGGDESYAARFGQIWEWAKDRLTAQGAYEIVVSDRRTFKKALALSERLLKEREVRVKNGLPAKL